jgi:hypothetical protein
MQALVLLTKVKLMPLVWLVSPELLDATVVLVSKTPMKLPDGMADSASLAYWW